MSTELERAAARKRTADYRRKNAAKVRDNNREWHRRNRATLRAAANAPVARALAHYRQIRRYGLSPAAYSDLIKSQIGCCAICVLPFTNGKDAHIDHNHATGTVRAILCTRCNQGIGSFLECPGRLSLAAAYCRRHGLLA